MKQAKVAQILSGGEGGGEQRRRAGSGGGNQGGRAPSGGTPQDRRRGSRESLEMSYDGEEVKKK